jgi:hypothetical protein
MKTLNIAILILSALPLFAGDCLKQVDFDGSDDFEATISATSQPSDECKASLAAIKPGDPVTITVGSTTGSALIVKKTALNFQPPVIVIDPTPLAPDGQRTLLRRLRSVQTAKVAVGSLNEEVGITVTGVATYTEQSLTIGPATARETDNSGTAAAAADTETGDESASHAIRVKYDYLYDYRPAEDQGLTARIDLNLDTTDEGGDFIDDNRLGITGGYGGFRFGDLLVEGLVGGRMRYTHAIHTGDHDQDAVVTFSGGVPLIQAWAFGGGNFAAPPLHFDLNYGYRRKRIGDDTSDGTFFEGTVQHNVFLMRDYWLAASATFTIDDADHPTTTSRTRRLYRVAISRINHDDRVVSLMTSFEDGSARVISNKVRQYFIGIGMNWKH